MFPVAQTLIPLDGTVFAASARSELTGQEAYGVGHRLDVRIQRAVHAGFRAELRCPHPECSTAVNYRKNTPAAIKARTGTWHGRWLAQEVVGS